MFQGQQGSRREVVNCFQVKMRELNFVFFGKTLYFHSTSLYPGVKVGTGKLNAGGNPAMD